MDKIKIKGLNAYEYQHPFDRKALALLKRTKGLATAIKKLSEYGIETFTKIKYTGSGLRVRPSNFPVIHSLLEEACEILDIGVVPELYLLRGDLFTATVGVDNPIIVLSQSIIDNFDEEELIYILGYQLSYIKSESILYQEMATALNLVASVGSLGSIGLLTVPINFAIKHWEKMSHYTADRAGMLCVQDVDSATSALIKLAGQPEKLYHQIDVDEFRRQAYEFDNFDLNNYNKIIKLLMALDETHPPYVIRGSEFFKWIKSGDYEKILNRKAVSNFNDSNCSFCGHNTTGDEDFCTNCGNRLSSEKINCPSCDEQILEDDPFCTYCGYSFLNE